MLVEEEEYLSSSEFREKRQEVRKELANLLRARSDLEDLSREKLIKPSRVRSDLEDLSDPNISLRILRKIVGVESEISIAKSAVSEAQSITDELEEIESILSSSLFKSLEDTISDSDSDKKRARARELLELEESTRIKLEEASKIVSSEQSRLLELVELDKKLIDEMSALREISIEESNSLGESIKREELSQLSENNNGLSPAASAAAAASAEVSAAAESAAVSGSVVGVEMSNLTPADAMDAGRRRLTRKLLTENRQQSGLRKINVDQWLQGSGSGYNMPCGEKPRLSTGPKRDDAEIKESCWEAGKDTDDSSSDDSNTTLVSDDQEDEGFITPPPPPTPPPTPTPTPPSPPPPPLQVFIAKKNMPKRAVDWFSHELDSDQWASPPPPSPSPPPPPPSPSPSPSPSP